MEKSRKKRVYDQIEPVDAQVTDDGHLEHADDTGGTTIQQIVQQLNDPENVIVAQ